MADRKHWQGNQGWSEWGLLDATPIESTPVAVSDTPGHVMLFARAHGEVVYKDWDASRGWTSWTSWGPVAPPPPPPPDGLARLRAGVRCTPPGGRLRVTLTIRKRAGRPKPRVRKVVFFVKHGPRRADRRRPFARRLRLPFPAGKSGRVYARALYTRKGSRKLHRLTVSRRFFMCG